MLFFFLFLFFNAHERLSYCCRFLSCVCAAAFMMTTYRRHVRESQQDNTHRHINYALDVLRYNYGCAL